MSKVIKHRRQTNISLKVCKIECLLMYLENALKRGRKLLGLKYSREKKIFRGRGFYLLKMRITCVDGNIGRIFLLYFSLSKIMLSRNGGIGDHPDNLGFF